MSTITARYPYRPARRAPIFRMQCRRILVTVALLVASMPAAARAQGSPFANKYFAAQPPSAQYIPPTDAPSPGPVLTPQSGGAPSGGYAAPSYAGTLPGPAPDGSGPLGVAPYGGLPPSVVPAAPSGPLSIPPPAPVFTYDELPPSRWTFSADILVLHRSIGTDNYLGGVYSLATGATVANLTAGDNGFSFQPGLRFKLGFRVNDAISWEAVYFGLQNWNTGHTLYANPIGAGTVADSYYTQSDWIIGGFGTSLGYYYSSSLNNFELNRLHHRDGYGGWKWATLVGFRYLNWSEHFDLNGYDGYYNVWENINVHTSNNLVGGQLGLQTEWNRNRFHLEMTGKAALAANFGYISASNLNSSGYQYGYPSGFQGYAASGWATNVAGVLDFSAVASYHITPHFLLRGGYQMLYIPGLDLAPGQLDDTIHRGGVFVHGPLAGLELRW